LLEGGRREDRHRLNDQWKVCPRNVLHMDGRRRKVRIDRPDDCILCEENAASQIGIELRTCARQLVAI